MKKFGRFILYILALVFPFAVFIARDQPTSAIAAIFLQGTAIGWPVATIWAFSELGKDKKKNSKADEAEANA